MTTTVSPTPDCTPLTASEISAWSSSLTLAFGWRSPADAAMFIGWLALAAMPRPRECQAQIAVSGPAACGKSLLATAGICLLGPQAVAVLSVERRDRRLNLPAGTGAVLIDNAENAHPELVHGLAQGDIATALFSVSQRRKLPGVMRLRLGPLPDDADPLEIETLLDDTAALQHRFSDTVKMAADEWGDHFWELRDTVIDECRRVEDAESLAGILAAWMILSRKHRLGDAKIIAVTMLDDIHGNT